MISQPQFKGSLSLCDGLDIFYGDDLQKHVSEWADRVSPETYRGCDLVFNYSENGNVLDGVASLANRVSFTTSYDRAVTASIWR